MNIPELLLQFYKDWLLWVSTGATTGGTFYRGWGLCANLSEWLRRKMDNYHEAEARTHDLMCKQFTDDGLDDAYPFNGGSATDFFLESDRYEQHENPLRVAWVTKMITEMSQCSAPSATEK